MLKDAGAELVFFSPLEDNALPEDIEGIYIGGGYPELHAAQLSRNEQMRMAIKERAESGMPIYAECGGLMYLSSAIQKSGDEKYDMAGVFRFDTVMKQRLARLGYREVMLNNDCIPGDAGTVMRGHEFHYSDIAGPGSGDVPNCYNLRNADGTELQPEGYTFKNVLGSYIHVHFGSSPGIAEHIINFMKKRGS
jgi:cobyrinic acid a,c-diamide synthase